MGIETDDRKTGSTAEARPGTVRMIATVAVLAVLVASVFALHGIIVARHNRAPYSAAAVRASVMMEMVAPGQAQAAVDQLAGPGRLRAPAVQSGEGHPTQQLLVGQLTFRTPQNAPKRGQYALFIIDRALNEPVSEVSATGPVGTQVAQGWDGRYDKVAAKYPWLQMLASTRAPDGSGFTSPGTAVDFAPDTPGPVTFTAALDPASQPVTDPAQQLTVALVFIGANDHIYWATKLAG
jgi:hypothetical protein